MEDSLHSNIKINFNLLLYLLYSIGNINIGSLHCDASVPKCTESVNLVLSLLSNAFNYKHTFLQKNIPQLVQEKR